MKLILMSTPSFFVEEHEILTALFQEGLDLLHLRKPASQPVYCERLISLLPEEFYKRIVVHDHYYLKNEYKLRGIHLNSRNTPPERIRGSVSLTVKNTEEIEKMRRSADYMLLSPEQVITPETSPSETERVFESYAAERLIDSKVMFMGGASLENVTLAKRAGFGGIVLYSSLWRYFDKHLAADFRELTNYFRKIKKLC